MPVGKTNLIINTAFKGEVAGGILGALFLEADTLKKGLIDEILNVTGRTVYLRAISLEDGLIDYQCKFEPAGGVEFGEKEVKLKKIMFPVELCKERFRQTYEGYQMGASASNHNAAIPIEPMEVLLEEIKGDVSSNLERDIWQGDFSKRGHFGGILTELVANDPTRIVKLKDANPEITYENVEDILDVVLEETPVEVQQHSDFKLVMDFKTKSRFKRSLRKANFAMAADEFDGFPIETANGLPASTILTYTKKNLKFLTGLKEDANHVEVLDMSSNTLDDMYRIKLVYMGGATYIKPEYITVYMGEASQTLLKARKPCPTEWLAGGDDIEADLDGHEDNKFDNGTED